MSITQLLEQVGLDNVKVQPLASSMTNISTNKKGVSKITFETTEMTANDLVLGGNTVGLVIWLPKDKIPSTSNSQPAKKGT